MKEKKTKVVAFKKFLDVASDFIIKSATVVTAVVVLIGGTLELSGLREKSDLYFIFKELLSEKKTYLSNFESDVGDEWVIPVEISESKDDLLREKGQLFEALEKSEYEPDDCKNSQHGCWRDNIFIVRNPKVKNSWMLVIDRLNGISSKKETQSEINDITRWLKRHSTGERDALEKFFQGKKAYFYDLKEFSKTYGAIQKEPSKNNITCLSENPIRLEEPGWNKKVKDSLEKLICENRNQHKKVVFDFDNTLVVGDIGEATFEQIVIDHRLDEDKILSRSLGGSNLDGGVGCKVADSYKLISYYEKLLCITNREGENEPYANGYAWVVQAMAGMTPKDIIKYTKTAYEGTHDSFYQKPSFYPEMVELIKILIENNYEIYIISASNIWTVRFMVKEYLNKELQSRYGSQNEKSHSIKIPLDRVFGINVLLKEKSTGKVFKDEYLILENKEYLEMADDELSKYELTSSITYPLSAYHGKVATILKSISLEKIFLAVGDSPNDFPMLKFSENKLWVARLEKPEYQEKMVKNSNFHSSWFIQPTLYKKNPGFIPSTEALMEKLDLTPSEKIRKSIDFLNNREVPGD